MLGHWNARRVQNHGQQQALACAAVQALPLQWLELAVQPHSWLQTLQLGPRVTSKVVDSVKAASLPKKYGGVSFQD